MDQFNQQYQQSEQNQAVTLTDSHRVMRNTYWLLALSMIPTVLGAWLGTRLDMSFITSHSLLRSYLTAGILLVSSQAIEHRKKSPLGIAILLAFTFLAGLYLSAIVSFTLDQSNGAILTVIAFGSTATIFGVMATIATVSKCRFS